MSFSSSVQLRLPTQEQIDKIIDFATGNKAAFSAIAVMGYTTAKLVLGAVFGQKKEKQQVQAVKFDPDTDADSLVAGDLYELCTTGVKGQTWFTLGDCLYRYSLVFAAHYWNMLTAPVSYLYYTLHYNQVWYGRWQGNLLTLFYPVMPFALMAKSIFKAIRDKFFAASSWMDDCPGNVFFIRPPSPLGSLIWSFYLDQSLYVGQYFLVGTDKDAIQHTWYDTILTKDFWSKTLTDVGARLPRRLGRWRTDHLEIDYPITTQNIVVKLPDSYLGIGDSFWNFGEDFNNLDELKAKLMATYGPSGKFAADDAIVMECVYPKKDIFKSHAPSYSDTHSIDIVTIRTPDDDVKVLSVLLWADCTTGSSHSTRAGYTVDVKTETVQDACGWYSTYFTTMDTPLLGMKIDGIKRACAAAVQAHKNIEHKWLTAVGWDCMVIEDELVFFEGNFAGARTPRRIFLGSAHMKNFISNFYWPFGSGSNVTPGFQAF